MLRVCFLISAGTCPIRGFVSYAVQGLSACKFFVFNKECSFICTAFAKDV